jgi:hypothetical protein
MENHDEPRAATTFHSRKHEAAAIVSYMSPGLRFFHQGQFEGRRARISPHLVRAPLEPVDKALRTFYERLLAVLRDPIVRDGEWRRLDCASAWDGNWTNDCFVASMWTDASGGRRMVAVNYAPTQSQCYVRMPAFDSSAHSIQFKDLMGPAVYDRSAQDIDARGLYLDISPWSYHVFDVHAA